MSWPEAFVEVVALLSFAAVLVALIYFLFKD